ncbi:MAG: ribonuclease P protein component [Candidatus Magasanikbacteria bacterium RIFOXYD2_FULL_39_9]|uniref:Ribonuclease P protein component n=1 Tax=Candidatus Magasanikbacteria bacterium RIFOXYD1_FULL_40_23 TaxID=1798705 RepID=A0A1F6P8Q4_9BACT|nr:MAG: ribonuclease P protein component [Candidatus Magasanikbacteria bacterium RIFOXYD2_FULL_39_9]OGH92547.1 MAG: ribonuclease P protein component [Candidatus Magasanikbacteria bacterium RIFOXYD1_FULL_40_23]
MLQQDNRLRKLRDFNLVLKHGYWANGQFLDIKVLELAKNTKFFPEKEDPINFQNQLKLAISTGLKVHKSAVKRNRVRRQIREVIRLLLKDGVIKNGYYILVVAKKDVLNKDYAAISQEVKVLLSKAKVLKA